MDWTTLAAAGMSLIGTLAGTFGGILVANKLTTYRIEQLEKKVAEHNKVVERTYKLEGRMTEAEHDIREGENAVLHQLATKVDDLEDKPAKRKIPAEAIQAPKIGAAREVAD